MAVWYAKLNKRLVILIPPRVAMTYTIVFRLLLCFLLAFRPFADTTRILW